MACSPICAMPAATPWPAEDLEAVPACPVCGRPAGRAWRTGLVDDVFACACGVWSFVRCERCGAAWLDPRPTRGSVMRAYALYYTHAPASIEAAPARGVTAALRRGYLRARWGYEVEPAWALGRHVLGERRRAALDLEVRHLARPEGRARVLDVGCGNGVFLARMQALGWDVHGLEPDPEAAAAARASGLDVRVRTLDDAGWPEASFRAVTLSSVLEHVHDPGAALAACLRLLEPGGTLHVVTPNVDALGAERFGPHWRGLEAPRHLVLFGRCSLDLLLRRAGFEGVAFHPRFAGEWFWLVSGAIERGLAPDRAGTLPRGARKRLEREGRWADRRAAREPGRAEELVATARRPGGSA